MNKMVPRKSKKTIALEAKPYISSGLPEAFAIAIVKGTKYEEVLDLWESKWWKQYQNDDMLIVAVLEGRLTEDQGKYLNLIRSDHERLALTCVENPDMIEWANALLVHGFDEVPEAVNNALDGGKPHVIARIRKMNNVNIELLPPALKKKVELKNPPLHMQEKLSLHTNSKNQKKLELLSAGKPLTKEQLRVHIEDWQCPICSKSNAYQRPDCYRCGLERDSKRPPKKAPAKKRSYKKKKRR